MTRGEFMARLRRGLAGVDPALLAETLADYDTHFDEAAAAGRSESEAAQALGDPERLARELKAEIGLKRWEEKKSPSNAAGAIAALIGLGALDILILIPLWMSVVSTILSFYLVAIIAFFAGGALMIAGPFVEHTGAPWPAILGGLGMTTAAVFLAAVMTLISIGVINLTVWYARLHYRFLKPVVESQAEKSQAERSAA